MRMSSVTAGAVALGIAVTAVVVTSVGGASADAVPTCRGDRITVAELAGGCTVSSGTVVLPDGRRFVVPRAGTTVSALPVASTGAGDPGDVSVTNAGRAGLAVRIDHAWSGSPAAIRLQQAAARPVASPHAATSAVAVKAASSCGNKTYTKLGFRWTAPVSWSYNTSGQKAAVAPVIRAGADAWTGAISACGKSVTSAAAERLVGNTTEPIAVSATGGCGASSGTSVIGWGPLKTGTLAVTCVWSRSGVAIEVDQRYSTTAAWSASSTCAGARYDLRGVATHEWGHAFGLGHTAQNSGLVMKPASTTCEVGQRTLGLGDLMGIDALY